MTKGQEEQSKKMGAVIKKAWEDEAFRQRLLKDATAVLKEEGVEVPAGLEVRAVENTDTVFHLVLPARRVGAALTDAQLEGISGGEPGGREPCRDVFGWCIWGHSTMEGPY